MFKKMDEWNESAELQSQFPTLEKYVRHVFEEIGESEQDEAVQNTKNSSANIFKNFVEKMSKPHDGDEELFI